MPRMLSRTEELAKVRRFEAAGLRVESVLGTAYVPGLSGPLARWTGGRVPYLRGEAAARLGRDLIVLGRRDD